MNYYHHIHRPPPHIQSILRLPVQYIHSGNVPQFPHLYMSTPLLHCLGWDLEPIKQSNIVNGVIL